MNLRPAARSAAMKNSSPSSLIAPGTICVTPSIPRVFARSLAGSRSETFDTGLRKTVEWYLTNRAWWQRDPRSVYRGERLGVPA